MRMAEIMRRLHPAFFILALGCGGEVHSPSDAGVLRDGRAVDADTECYPLGFEGPGLCSFNACLGVGECIDAPCEYPCCVGGVLYTCEYADRAECTAPLARSCPGGGCVTGAEACP